MILAEFQPQRGFRRLVKENPESFVAARDGADQRKLGRLDLLFSWWRLDEHWFGGDRSRRVKDKARASARFRRPTKVFEEALEKGGANLRVLKLPGGLPIEGGLPIIHEGKIIGAIGVSGVKANEDGQVAQAGLAGLK